MSFSIFVLLLSSCEQLSKKIEPAEQNIFVPQTQMGNLALAQKQLIEKRIKLYEQYDLVPEQQARYSDEDTEIDYEDFVLLLKDYTGKKKRTFLNRSAESEILTLEEELEKLVKEENDSINPLYLILLQLKHLILLKLKMT